jgi:hypothetical protein
VAEKIAARGQQQHKGNRGGETGSYDRDRAGDLPARGGASQQPSRGNRRFDAKASGQTKNQDGRREGGARAQGGRGRAGEDSSSGSELSVEWARPQLRSRHGVEIKARS